MAKKLCRRRYEPCRVYTQPLHRDDGNPVAAQFQFLQSLIVAFLSSVRILIPDVIVAEFMRHDRRAHPYRTGSGPLSRSGGQSGRAARRRHVPPTVISRSSMSCSRWWNPNNGRMAASFAASVYATTGRRCCRWDARSNYSDFVVRRVAGDDLHQRTKVAKRLGLLRGLTYRRLLRSRRRPRRVSAKTPASNRDASRFSVSRVMLRRRLMRAPKMQRAAQPAAPVRSAAARSITR